MKKLRVTVDGKAYEVIVEELEGGGPAAPSVHAPAPVSHGASVSAPVATAAAPQASAGPGQVPSPLAGRVVSINCTVGQAVESGATLITLEAMKMNTFVYASRAGKVTAIHVQSGDAVEEGQALVTIE